MFAGFLEGLILLSLTFFFGTFWGGNLYYTMIYLVTTLVVVSIGRALGIVYVKWSEATNGFSVIECAEVAEVRGVLRILASLNEEVMVEVNQAYYVQGRRIDRHPDFKKWLEDCERGDYDVVRAAQDMAREEQGKMDAEGGPDAATSLLAREGDGESVQLTDWRSSTQTQLGEAVERLASGVDSEEEQGTEAMERPTYHRISSIQHAEEPHSPLDR